MRLPFIQVQQDAFPRVKLLAGYLRVSRREAMGLAVDLWATGVELTPEGTPDDLVGVFTEADPAGMLAAALEWPDPQALYSALVRAGLVETIGEAGFRIKGLRDLYAEALSLSNKRSEAGRRGAAKRWQGGNNAMANGWQSDGKRLANDGQTQTQTQTQKQPTAGGSDTGNPLAATGAITAPESILAGAMPGRRAEDRPASHETLRDRMERAWREETGQEFRWRTADDAALREVLDLAHGDWGEVERVWRNAARAAFPKCLNVASLARHWNAYANEAQPKKPATGGGTPVPMKHLG